MTKLEENFLNAIRDLLGYGPGCGCGMPFSGLEVSDSSDTFDWNVEVPLEEDHLELVCTRNGDREVKRFRLSITEIK